jgi:autotransporter-associated beta strand protein
MVLGDTTSASNQTLAGLTATGLGGSVVGGNATTDSMLTLNIASGTNTFGGVLGGAGTNENKLTLTKAGSGTLELSGASTYSGDTTVSAGTLVLANNSAAGSAGDIKLNGSTSTLQINSGITVANDIMVSNSAASVSRNVASSAAYTVGSSAGLTSDFSADSKPNTTAKILAGTNSGSATDLTMKFDTTLPVAPSNDPIRRTDIFTLTGVSANAATTGIADDTDTFVIQLSAAALATDSVLAWDNGSSWVNAVAGNKGTNTTNSNYLNYQGSFADFLNSYTFDAATMLGAYGVGGNTVWAVVDHTGSFAAIPESTSALVGLLIGAGLLRRRRAVQG